MLTQTLVIIASVAAVLAVVISKQPDEFRVSRTAVVNANAAKVYANVNQMKSWEAWSPWAKLDPNAKTTFEGPAAGKGAVMRWEGNNKVGSGAMTIEESRPVEYIRFRLDFLKPFENTSNSEFTFKPQGDDKTEVTWNMYGKANFISKAMGLFMDCNKMVGDQFEKGLANLNEVVSK